MKPIEKERRNFASKNNDKSVVKSNALKIASKVQLNIAEYSGLLIVMLLYIPTEMNRNKKLSKTGVYSIYASVAASNISAIGYSSVKSLLNKQQTYTINKQPCFVNK